MNDVRFGLIGAGRHGVRYAKHLARGDVAGARLTALCRRDRSAGRAQAARWGVAYYADASSLAEDPNVDALLVASPSDHHVEAVEAAAAASKPVLVEKPLAPDLPSCDAIAALAAGAPIDVMVAQTTRYEGPIVALAGALPRIGTVREACFSLRSEDRTHEEGIYRPERCDGGALLDSGVHYFDLLPRLIGPIEKVWCERHYTRETPIDDGYTALFRARSGARAVIDMGRWGAARHETIQVAGEEGILVASRTPPSVWWIAPGAREELDLPVAGGTLVPMLADFLSVCRREAPPPISIADGRAAVALVEACRESEGRWVRAF